MKIATISSEVYPNNPIHDHHFAKSLCRGLVDIGVNIVPAYDMNACDAVLVFHSSLGRDVRPTDLPVVDAPVILIDERVPESIAAIKHEPDDSRREFLEHFDLVVVSAGGPKVCAEYSRLGAKQTCMIHAAAKPIRQESTDSKDDFDVLFIGDSDPKWNDRVEEFMLGAAALQPARKFVLSGYGWDKISLPHNVAHMNNRFSQPSARFVLNLTGKSMRRYGYCPSISMFETAASGACIISDSWPGLSSFFKLGHEVLVAESGRDIAIYLNSLTSQDTLKLSLAARKRVLANHTWAIRARELLTHISTLTDKPKPIPLAIAA